MNEKLKKELSLAIGKFLLENHVKPYDMILALHEIVGYYLDEFPKLERIEKRMQEYIENRNNENK